MVGALGYWFILLLPYKSIAKHPYQLQKPEDILFYIKYNYDIISWCCKKHIYSNNSSLRATKGKFYTIKQLWRLCQSLCCLRSTSTSSIRLCLTLFPTLFLRLYYYNIPCMLWLKLWWVTPSVWTWLVSTDLSSGLGLASGVVRTLLYSPLL